MEDTNLVFLDEPITGSPVNLVFGETNAPVIVVDNLSRSFFSTLLVI